MGLSPGNVEHLSVWRLFGLIVDLSHDQTGQHLDIVSPILDPFPTVNESLIRVLNDFPFHFHPLKAVPHVPV